MRRCHLLISLCLTYSNQVIANTDLIECKRDKPETRQFCYIKDNNFGIEIALPGIGGLQRGDSSYLYETDLFKSLQDAGIYLVKGDQSKDFLEVASLRPDMSFTIAWNDLPECRRNSLWQHDIRVQIYGMSVAKVSRGDEQYVLDLANYFTDQFEPLTVSRDESLDRVLIKTELAIKDLTFDPSVPLPFERIPASCKMQISDPKLEFDPIAIRQELAFIRELSESKATILSKAAVIHSNIIDQQNGAICRSHKLGSILKDAEALFPDESLLDLSLRSRNYLETLLFQAKGLGVSELAGIEREDLLPYLDLSSEDLEQRCKLLPDDRISKDRFIVNGSIVNQQGYDNAELFERELANLESLLGVSWAMATASEFSANIPIDSDWLEGADLYVHFN